MDTIALKIVLKQKLSVDDRQSAIAQVQFISYNNKFTYEISGTNDINLTGNVDDIQRVFGLQNRTGTAIIPTSMEKYVQEIKSTHLGSYLIRQTADRAVSRALKSFSPLEVAAAYKFPASTGLGQRIGIIELGGGFVLSDLTTYFKNLSIAYVPNVSIVSVNGGINNVGSTDSGANLEVALDVQIIAAIVPESTIKVYFAPNSFKGFYDAIATAVNDGCQIISISWGAPESQWGATNLTTFNALFKSAYDKGVSIYAAAGDNGSSDGLSGTNVDFPGSSPYVISCGGTRLEASGSLIQSEIVWNNNPATSATGGGISKYFAKPTYQSNISALSGSAYRGVPDAAANADPVTGYLIYCAKEGGNVVIGGTSAVSPLLSALHARLNTIIGSNIGPIHNLIYGNSVCNDVLVGSNGAFVAMSGWDACSGTGSVDGSKILTKLQGGTVSPPVVLAPVASFTATPTSGTYPVSVRFTDTSVNAPTQWLWSFGDGKTSVAQNPTNIYQKSGTFTVSLTATNTSGSNMSVRNSYVVVLAPLAPGTSFTYTISNRTTNGFTATFKDTSTNSPTRWLWNFGDGTASTLQNPSHTYKSKGPFNVRLTATNSVGSKSITKTVTR